jgi:hypothetical protein
MQFLSSESSAFRTGSAAAVTTGSPKATTASVTKSATGYATSTGTLATAMSKSGAEGRFANAVPVVGGVMVGLVWLIGFLL